MVTIKYTIEIDEDLYYQLQELAEDEDTSVSELLDDIFESYFSAKKETEN